MALHDVGLQVVDELFENLELPVGVRIEELVHRLGLLVQVDEHFLEGHQAVRALEKAAETGNHDQRGFPVDLFDRLLGVTPVQVRDDGELDVVTPFRDVLDDLVLVVDDRDPAGVAGQEAQRPAPVVDCRLPRELEDVPYGNGIHDTVELDFWKGLEPVPHPSDGFFIPQGGQEHLF